MSNPWDVIIAGGGFTGTTTAAALAGIGRRVLVLEGRTGTDPRFRGELIHPTGAAVLDRLGLIGPLHAAGGIDVAGFAIVEDVSPAAPPLILLPYAEVDIKGARTTGFAMDHREMLATLRREVSARPGVEIRFGQRVVDLLSEGERVVGVRLADGTEHRAPLTVIAEGRHSKLRTAAGIAEDNHLLSWTAAILVEGTNLLPEAGHGHVILGAPGPILAYPIHRERIRMVIDLPSELSKGREQVMALLRTQYAPHVPSPLREGMLAALAAEPPEMCANHAIYTRTCVLPGLALVGDAAGCSHPLAASGMTVVLSDVELIAQALAENDVLDTALEQYQRRRYPFARSREVLSDALYGVLRGGDPGNAALREGICAYWRRSRRARTASLGVLSGYRSGVMPFVAEYLRVLTLTTGQVLMDKRGGMTLRDRLGRLDLALRASWARMSRSAEIMLQGVRPGQRLPVKKAASQSVPSTSERRREPEQRLPN